jgi:hypothetical protein
VQRERDLLGVVDVAAQPRDGGARGRPQRPPDQLGHRPVLLAEVHRHALDLLEADLDALREPQALAAGVEVEVGPLLEPLGVRVAGDRRQHGELEVESGPAERHLHVRVEVGLAAQRSAPADQLEAAAAVHAEPGPRQREVQAIALDHRRRAVVVATDDLEGDVDLGALAGPACTRCARSGRPRRRP